MKHMDDKKLFDMFQKIDMEPSDEFKEKSFQNALKGLELARKKERRKRVIMNWRVALSLTSALAVAVILIIPFLFQPDDEKNLTIQNQPEHHAETPNENIQEKFDTVDRPETVELTVLLEGTEEKELYKLVNMEELPFTTYIPTPWYTESIAENGMPGIRLVPVDEQYGKIDIVFFSNETSLEEAEAFVLDNKLSRYQYALLTKEQEQARNVPEWTKQTFVYGDEPRTKSGEILIGEHLGNYFYVQSEFSNEALEGWGARKYVILEQWEWKQPKE